MSAGDIDALVEHARAAWPRLAVDARDFREFLAEKGVTDPARAADLYVTFAVSRHVPGAARTLEDAFAPSLRKALAALRLSPPEVDDALQIVWRDLLTGDAPRVAQFDGAGDLRAWLRVAATRVALRSSKKAKRESPDAEAGELAEGAAADPELMLLKAEYRAHFHEAVKNAIEAMPKAEAMLLRQHLIDGLGIDQLCKLYDIHRATAARRLAAARESLALAIREEFKRRARLDDSECESVLRLVRSSLDLTLKRHFAAK